MKVFDALNRPLRDLRISVMDQCNLRCTYCMPKEIFGDNYTFLPQEKLLTFDEIIRLVKIFTSIGVEKIRLTGGEPLLRKGLPELIERILKVEGVNDLSLTTNGILLGAYAKKLKEAGLKRVNVSLDSLNQATYGVMNGRNFPVERVLKSIDQAAAEGLLVKINMVVQKGVNDHEVLPLAQYCFDKGYTLRFIEFMDVGNSNGWNVEQVVASRDILQQLQEGMNYSLKPVDPQYVGEVAKRYRYEGTDKEIGFISSITEVFCSTCNRARISADGKLFTCLFASDGVDVVSLLRSTEFTDKRLEEKLKLIWTNRKDRYSEERLFQTNKEVKKIEMSYIGG